MIVRTAITLSLLYIGIVGFGTVSAAEQQEVKDIALAWKPSENEKGAYPLDTTVFKNKKIIIRPFVDKRPHPAEIGRNTEDRGSAGRLVTTKDNVPSWLRTRFIQVLNAFEIAPAENHGDIVLDADILKFYVTESSKYNSEIELNITFTRNDGKTLWAGKIVGKSHRIGQSFNAYNYNEALSNACIDVVHALLKNYQIKLALQ